MIRTFSHSGIFRQKALVRGRSVPFSAVFFYLSVQFFFMSVNVAFCDGTDQEYFDYGRFAVKKATIENIPENKRAKDEVKRFSEFFEKGKELLLQGDIEGAKAELLEARKAWPEYFGTDFVIARALEISGDDLNAARYYRSYLDKLRDFHTGRYRISGAIIRFISKGKVEGYDVAKRTISEHLRRRGIDINRIRPMTADSGIAVYILSLTLFFVLYLFIAIKVVPVIRIKMRSRKPPEGFWVCKYCGGMSTELSKVCNECRRIRG